MAQCFGDPSPRGNNIVVYFIAGASLLIAVSYGLADGLPAFLLVYLAILPAIIILALLRIKHEKDLSVSLYSEAFLAGCVISIAAATVFELFGQLSSSPIWRCEKSPYFTWQCDVAFVIVVILSVGLSEEVAKFLPLCCVKLRARHLPASCFFRVVDTPIGICLCGCASAAGFATIENIKYTLKSSQGDITYGFSTAVLRALLAIPFHVACTGYAAALYGQHGFIVPARLANDAEEESRVGGDRSRSMWGLFRRWWWSSAGRHSPGVTALQGPAGGTSHFSLLLPGETSTTDRQLAAASSLVYEPLGVWQTLSLLIVPTLAHGLYDSGLFLSAQLLTAGARQDDALSRLTILIAQARGGFKLPPPYKTNDIGDAVMYQFLGLVMLAISLTAYVVMLSKFAARWRALLRFQCNAIPMQSRLYDFPM